MVCQLSVTVTDEQIVERKVCMVHDFKSSVLWPLASGEVINHSRSTWSSQTSQLGSERSERTAHPTFSSRVYSVGTVRSPLGAKQNQDP